MPRSIVLPSALALALMAGGCSGDDTIEPPAVPSTAVTTTSVVVVTSTTTPVSTTTSSMPTPTTTPVPAPVVGDELVFNGDFSEGEGTPSGWELSADGEGQAAEYVLESGQQHVSFEAPVLESDVWPEARLTRRFEVTPHTDYRITVEARAVTEGRLFLALVFFDDDGDEILLRGPGSPHVPSPDWGTLEATVESPARAVSAVLVMSLAIYPELTEAEFSSVDVNRVSVREVLDS